MAGWFIISSTHTHTHILLAIKAEMQVCSAAAVTANHAPDAHSPYPAGLAALAGAAAEPTCSQPKFTG